MSTTVRTRFNCLHVILIVVLIMGLPVFMANAAPHGTSQQLSIRFCSKNLSDALYLVCRDRGGYAEPFGYSGEEYARAPSGPGLVAECCYRSCTLRQLEQYCKPAPDEKTQNSQNSGIEESLTIVNLPYSSIRESPSERRVESTTRQPNKTDKSKDRNSTKIEERSMCDRKHADDHGRRGFMGAKMRDAKRRRRINGRGRGVRIHKKRNRDDNDDRVKDMTRRDCRRQRRKRRRQGKALLEAAMANLREFQVGTTEPEPKNSTLLLFPSKSNLGFPQITNNLAAILDFDVPETSNSIRLDDRFYNKIRDIDHALEIEQP